MSWESSNGSESASASGGGDGDMKTKASNRMGQLSSLRIDTAGAGAGVGGGAGAGAGFDQESEYAIALLIAKYGGEGLTSLRRAADALDFIAACAKLRRKPWAAMADEWGRAVAQVIAQIEDTNLASNEPVEQKQLTTEDTLKCCIREHTTIILHTQTKNGEKRDVEVEPYRLATDQRSQDMTLTCWNIDHSHIERLALHRILYSKGIGIHFVPRFDSYIEGEDEDEDNKENEEQPDATEE